jgi:hypothetical protein
MYELPVLYCIVRCNVQWMSYRYICTVLYSVVYLMPVLYSVVYEIPILYCTVQRVGYQYYMYSICNTVLYCAVSVLSVLYSIWTTSMYSVLSVSTVMYSGVYKLCNVWTIYSVLCSAVYILPVKYSILTTVCTVPYAHWYTASTVHCMNYQHCIVQCMRSCTEQCGDIPPALYSTVYELPVLKLPSSPQCVALQQACVKCV